MQMDAASGGRARWLPGATIRQLVLAAWRLGSWGLLAVGVSGALAAGLGAGFGRSFVAGDAPGFSYTAARCADFLEYAPGARTCEQAATIHHFGEVVDYRIAAGLLGLIGLAAYLTLGRRLARSPSVLPDGFEATVGFTLYAGAAVALLGLFANQVVIGQRAGAGAWLSGGIVALVAAGVYGLSVYRALLRRSPDP